MSDKLSAEKRQEYRDAFNLFDKDGGGTIDVDELAQVLRMCGKKPSSRELAAIVKDVDTDGSGEIDFEEFVGMMARMNNSSTKADEDKESFAFFDNEETGYITAQNLVRQMKILGETVSLEEARDLISIADIDGDGRVSFTDFQKFFA